MSQLGVGVWMAIVALGQVNAEPEGEAAVREEQMRFLKQKSEELSLFPLPDAKSPLPLLKRAVLRYSNPEG
jgi:hypothetical protein